jgi:hypothetical protein
MGGGELEPATNKLTIFRSLQFLSLPVFHCATTGLTISETRAEPGNTGRFPVIGGE